MIKKRNTATKRKIKHVFTELLIEKGFMELTVSDITRKADINRGTFYLHYLDKYDLKDQLINDTIEDFARILHEHRTIDPKKPHDVIPYDTILMVLEYCKENLAFINALIVNEGTDFIAKFKETVQHLIEDVIKSDDLLSNNLNGVPQIYAREILLSSIVSIIILWIRNGGQETTTEIADIVEIAKAMSPYETLKSGHINNL